MIAAAAGQGSYLAPSSQSPVSEPPPSSSGSTPVPELPAPMPITPYQSSRLVSQAFVSSSASESGHTGPLFNASHPSATQPFLGFDRLQVPVSQSQANQARLRSAA